MGLNRDGYQSEGAVDDQVPALLTSRVSAPLRQLGQAEPELFLGLTAGVVGLVSLVTLAFMAVVPSTAFTWWLLGVLQAILVGTYLHLLHAAFLAHGGEAIWHLRGAWGEENTRSELQRAKRANG